MSKALEALERIKKIRVNGGFDTIEYYPIYKESLDLIETALKEKEELEKLLEHERELNNHLIIHEFKALKKFKALEIIKSKEVNVFIFLHSGDLESYNDMVEDNRKLIIEDYDLLKDVLL